MKIYFHLNLMGFSNSYIVVNEEAHEAIIVDPGKITEEIIAQLEDGNHALKAVLVTHNHENHMQGLRTLQKIYAPQIVAADWETAGTHTTVIQGDGMLTLAGMTVIYRALPGHSPDSIAYRIGNVIFTGDVLSAGKIGTTTNAYSERLLRTNIIQKILSQTDETILMPGHGPPTSVGIERRYNRALRNEK